MSDDTAGIIGFIFLMLLSLGAGAWLGSPSNINGTIIKIVDNGIVLENNKKERKFYIINRHNLEIIKEGQVCEFIKTGGELYLDKRK